MRALRGEDLLLSRQVRCERQWLGSEGARWCIWPGGLNRESVVYSFGIGDDISFDLELIRSFGVTVHAFDPTPRASEWVTAQDVPPQFVVHAVGLAAFDGVARFSPPEDPSHVSYSMVSGITEGFAEGKVRRLSTIARNLGHDEIDLLKMDIEGGEYEALAEIVAGTVPIRQLLVEFHHRKPKIGFARTRDTIAKLNKCGFRVFDVAPSGEEYSFVNVNSRGMRQTGVPVP